MKSTDIKNWRYKLTYKEITELEDFQDLLLKAIAEDGCFMCGGAKGLDDHGVCFECSFNGFSREDKEAEEKVRSKYKVTRTVAVDTV